jgi:hypothetical protein
MRDDSVTLSSDSSAEKAMNVLRFLGRVAALLPSLLVAASVAAQTPTPAAKPAAAAEKAKPAQKAAASDFKLILEPRAMDLLKATSAKLAAAKSMSFTATVGYEYPSKLGPPIVYTSRYDVTMQRPDKLRIISPGDGPMSEFYYDGKTMTAYAPVENLAAVAPAPPTIDGALEAAYKNSAIFFPFEDLIAADPYAALTDGGILAFYIGQSSSVGSVKTDMLAWANKDVFLQIWIGADDKLPRRVRAMYAADPLALHHELELSNWQLDPVVAPDTFASAKAQSAGKMAFAAPAPPPRGMKPLTAGTPKKGAAAAAPAAAK